MKPQQIENKIYGIRHQHVMLDFDLAEMYQIETRVLKQAVRRNLERFPKDFMFQLNKTEWNELITICDNLPENINIVQQRLLHLQNKVLPCSQVY